MPTLPTLLWVNSNLVNSFGHTWKQIALVSVICLIYTDGFLKLTGFILLNRRMHS